MQIFGEGAGDGNPAEAELTVVAGLFERDSGALRSAEFDGDLDELLEGVFRGVGKEMRQTSESVSVVTGVSGFYGAARESGVEKQVSKVHSGFGVVDLGGQRGLRDGDEQSDVADAGF